jgi:hypothetical protein
MVRSGFSSIHHSPFTIDQSSDWFPDKDARLVSRRGVLKSDAWCLRSNASVLPKSARRTSNFFSKQSISERADWSVAAYCRLAQTLLNSGDGRF